MKLIVKDIVYISLFTSILFIQEQLLSSIPNIQLTIFLIIFFSKKLKFMHTFLIILIHVILDSLLNGSFNLLYFPSMLLSYLFILISLKTFFRSINRYLYLSILSILFSIVFSLSFLYPNVLIYHTNPLHYLIADLPFMILLSMSSFISTYILYTPLSRVFEHFKV